MLPSVFPTRVIQFSGPTPVSLFPPPEMGEGEGEGGGGGRWRAQAVLLPPSPPSPARGEGVEGPGRRGKNRELHGPGSPRPSWVAAHAQRDLRAIPGGRSAPA